MNNLLRRFFSRRSTSRTVKRPVPPRRRLRGFIEELEDRLLLHGVDFTDIPDITVPAGQTFHVPLDAFQDEGNAVTFSATSSESGLTLFVPTGNSSLRIGTTVGGVEQVDMILQLFSDLTPETVQAITNLVNADFYSHAALTTSFSGTNNDLIFTAVAEGAGGSGISIQFSNPGVADSALSLTVTGQAIRINLATDGTGAIAATNTAEAIRNFIQTDASADGVAARALVNVDLADSAGTGVVSTLAATNLRNRIFHRIIPDFVAQLGNDTSGGFPNTGALVGHPPVSLDALRDEYDSRLAFNGFAQLAMAKVATDDSGTGQFFITDADLSVGNPSRLPPRHLNFDHTIFGQLVEGIEALTNIIAVGTASGTPSSQVLITQMDVFTDVQNGVLRITVPSTFTGSAIITVTATDGTAEGTTEQQFMLTAVADTVNDKPFLGPINQATTIGRSVTFNIPFTDLEAADAHTFAVGSPTNFLQDDDADGTVDEAELVHQPTNATVVLNRDTGQLTVTPNPGFSGTLTLQVGVRDADHGTGLSAFDTEVITLEVGVNQAPMAIDQTVTTVPNTAVSITLTGDDGDDPAVQALTFRIQSLPANGTLRDSAGNLVTVGANLPTATVRYTPNAGFAGQDTFTFDVVDNGGTEGGGLDTDLTPATVTINVGANNEPTANDQTVAVVEGADTAITLTGDDGEPDIVQPLTFRLQSLPAHGRLFNSAGTLLTAADIGQALPSPNLTYSPDMAFIGTDTFSFDVMDNGGTEEGGDDTSEPATVTLNVAAAERGGGINRSGGVLSIRGDGEDNDISVALNLAGDRIVVTVDDHDPRVFALGTIFTINISGGAGDDTIEIDEGIEVNAQVSGGAGDDDITTGPGNDVLRGNAGDDTLDSGDGNDLLVGGLGADELTGGDGNDVLVGGRDDDQMAGDEGNDRLRGQLGDDDMTGGEGNDRMQGNQGDDILEGDEDNDRILGGMGNDELMGGDGDDMIKGGPRELHPGTDDDEIDAGEGDDRVHGGMGDDTMDGGDGDDRIRAGIGDDEMDGGDGDDRLRGGRGADDMLGGDGDDRLRGRRGDDTMDGEGGADYISGGRGEDDYGPADEDDRRVGFKEGKDTEGPDLLAAVVQPSTLPGAPAVSQTHVDGTISYAGFSNPPTYGPHHGFDSDGTDVNPGITPRPTGVYTTAQPDEDLIHNLEHGHIWISYDPAVVSATTVNQLVAIVREFGQEDTTVLGTGEGIIMTPRTANDDAQPIALAAWDRLLRLGATLTAENQQRVREFIRRFRGETGPEGFITP